ncbi:peptide chain release factor N(5)-glutamine methyltransferase [Paenibacillus gansuensis]|uniref:Release factor glutamine methyltransferase n=1 Tax=Paenibacillus gansuensis TaxID=306542 RepID=A0ABW5PLZ6_9BACL
MSLSIREAFVKASLFLEEHGVAEARSNAELLLMHVMGLDRTGLLVRWSEPFPAEVSEAWEAVLARKAAGEPAQYIIGRQEFYGLPFEVGPAVLIPRPETELLVEEVIRVGRQVWPDGAPQLVDIGTGSGAIPVAIATECPAWRVATSDISPAAIEVAKRNARANGVADRVTFLQGDLLEPVIDAGWAVDILVSNPPYIPSADIPDLQPEVRAFEPMSALDGGDDGLTPYRRMVEQLPRLAGGVPRLIGFEVGMGQARDVAAMLRAAAPWDDVWIIPDLAGIERHVLAVRRGN